MGTDLGSQFGMAFLHPFQILYEDMSLWAKA